MSESMVERVARALCEADGHDPDADWSEVAWRTYEPGARAAIAAMREPTDAMAVAGDDAIEQATTFDVIEDESQVIVTVPSPPLDAETVAWRAMIDKALK